MADARRASLDISRMTRRAAYYFAISIVILGIGFAALSFMTDGHRVLVAFHTLPPGTIAAVLGLALFNYAVRAWRFKNYAERLSLRAAYPEMLVYYVAGFAMSMSPGKLGEMTRLWLLKRRYGFGYRKGIALQIADRASDVCASVILCLIGMIHFQAYRGAVLAMAAIVAAGLALLMWPGQILKLIRAFYGIVRKQPRLFVRLMHTVQNVSFIFRPDILAPSLILGMLGWGAECYALYLVLDGLGSPIGFMEALFIFSFSSLAGGLTMLPGGLGGVELTMFALLALNHVPADVATAATVVVRLCTLWFGIILGFFDLLLAVKLSAARPALVSPLDGRPQEG